MKAIKIKNNTYLWCRKIKVIKLKKNPLIQFILSTYNIQSPILRVVRATEVNKTESLYLLWYMNKYLSKWTALRFKLIKLYKCLEEIIFHWKNWELKEKHFIWAAKNVLMWFLKIRINKGGVFKWRTNEEEWLNMTNTTGVTQKR